jgi:hypothetical protein
MAMLLPNRQHSLVATERKEYVLDVDQHDRACIDAVCSAVLDAVLPEARTGTLDGFHDEWPEIPKEVVNLSEEFRRIHGDDNLMGLTFDLRDEGQRRDFVTYAPWSIAAEVTDAEGRMLAAFDDSGTGISIRAIDHDLAQLRERLAEAGYGDIEAVPQDVWVARRKRARRRNLVDGIRALLGRR